MPPPVVAVAVGSRAVDAKARRGDAGCAVPLRQSAARRLAPTPALGLGLLRPEIDRNNIC